MTNGVRLQTKLRPRSARETAARARSRSQASQSSGPSFLDDRDFVFSAFGWATLELNANFTVSPSLMKWAVPAPTTRFFDLAALQSMRCSTSRAPFLFAAPPLEHRRANIQAGEAPKNVIILFYSLESENETRLRTRPTTATRQAPVKFAVPATPSSVLRRPSRCERSPFGRWRSLRLIEWVLGWVACKSDFYRCGLDI